jgi:hypothetical protein
MRRLLLPFVLAPPLALIVVGSFGSGTTATLVGLVLAGVLGAVGAWVAFGRGGTRGLSRPTENHTGSSIHVVWVARNGNDAAEVRTEADVVALIR